VNQLGLPFSINASFILDDFSGEKNQELVANILTLIKGKATANIFVYGDKGFGKSHLLQGVIIEGLKLDQKSVYIDLNDDVSPDIFELISDFQIIALDNIDQCNQDNEKYIFDLINKLHSTNQMIVFSSRVKPEGLSVFNDLKTRLSLANTYSLNRLDDDEIQHVIKRKLNNKSLKVDQRVIDYLIKNQTRDLKKIVEIIDKLDTFSLEKKRGITVPLVRQMLG
jgi:DnaA family protein